MCVSPIKLTVKGKVRSFPCGKCYECVNAASMDRSKTLRLDMANYKYSSFCLLTYRSDFMPLAEVSEYDFHSQSCVVTPITDRVLDEPTSFYLKGGIVKLTSYDYVKSMSYFFNCKEVKSGRKMYGFNTVPLLHFPDVRRFMDALKHSLRSAYIRGVLHMSYKSFIKQYGKKSLSNYTPRIRYYLIGEYSPVNCRPHYHLAIYHNSEFYASVMSDCVRKSWSYGLATCKRATGDGFKKYITEYITCNTSLPKVLRCASPAKSLHSTRLGFECTPETLEGLREAILSACIDGFEIDGHVERPYSLSGNLTCRLLPKITGFGSEPYMLHRYLFGAYRDAAVMHGETRISRLVKLCFKDGCVRLPWYFYRLDWYKKTDTMASALRRIFYISKYYYRLSIINNVTLDYVYDYVRDTYAILSNYKLKCFYENLINPQAIDAESLSYTPFDKAVIRALSYSDFQCIESSQDFEANWDKWISSGSYLSDNRTLLYNYYKSDSYLYRTSTYRQFIIRLIQLSREVAVKRYQSSRELYLSRIKHRILNEKMDLLFND